MRMIAALVVTLNMVILIFAGGLVLGDDADSDNSGSYFGPMQQDNETTPQPVTLYMYGSADSGELRTDFPTNGSGNSAPPAQYGGGNLPGGIGWYVGEWISPQVTASMTVESAVNGAFWATGSGQGVTIYVYIDHNGNEIGRDGTDTKNVNGDTEFLFTTTISGVNMAVGDTISIRIYAGSQVGSNFQVTWGSMQYNSHITFTCNPIMVTVNEPIVLEEELGEGVVFSATVFDAFSSPMLWGKIMVSGPTTVVNIFGPIIFQGLNSTLITWLWDHKTDKGKDGDYMITISVSYSEEEENEFSGFGKYAIEFPEDEKEDKGFLGDYGWVLHPIIVVVVIVVGVVAYKKIKSKKEEKSAV